MDAILGQLNEKLEELKNVKTASKGKGLDEFLDKTTVIEDFVKSKVEEVKSHNATTSAKKQSGHNIPKSATVKHQSKSKQSTSENDKRPTNQDAINALFGTNSSGNTQDVIANILGKTFANKNQDIIDSVLKTTTAKEEEAISSEVDDTNTTYRLLEQEEQLKCAVCPKEEGLCKCNGCKHIKYCSISCQKKDWKRHKLHCSLITPNGLTLGNLCIFVEDLQKYTHIYKDRVLCLYKYIDYMQFCYLDKNKLRVKLNYINSIIYKSFDMDEPEFVELGYSLKEGLHIPYSRLSKPFLDGKEALIISRKVFTSGILDLTFIESKDSIYETFNFFRSINV